MKVLVAEQRTAVKDVQGRIIGYEITRDYVERSGAWVTTATVTPQPTVKQRAPVTAATQTQRKLTTTAAQPQQPCQCAQCRPQPPRTQEFFAPAPNTFERIAEVQRKRDAGEPIRPTEPQVGSFWHPAPILRTCSHCGRFNCVCPPVEAPNTFARAAELQRKREQGQLG